MCWWKLIEIALNYSFSSRNEIIQITQIFNPSLNNIILKLLFKTRFECKYCSIFRNMNVIVRLNLSENQENINIKFLYKI